MTTKTNGGPRIIAIVIIGAIMVGLLIAGALYVQIHPDTPTTFTATAGVESDDGITPVEMESCVALVDTSGSMRNVSTIVANYEMIIPFSKSLGIKGGCSFITTCTVEELDKGVERLAVVSDLMSNPNKDVEAINGKLYKNRELIFFVPTNVDSNWLNTYENNFSKAMDSDTCTLKFIDLEGNILRVPFDNYYSSTASNAESPVMVTINYKDGSHVPTSVVIILLIGLLEVILALIIALIAMHGREQTIITMTSPQPISDTAVPVNVRKALNNTTLLDGSGSVGNIYQRMISWANDVGVMKVWRFAGTVEELSIDQAAAKSAEGQTNGWTAVKKVYEKGAKKITIVSDFEFNDQEDAAKGVHFEEIVCVSNTTNSETLEKLRGMCDKLTTISLTL